MQFATPKLVTASFGVAVFARSNRAETVLKPLSAFAQSAAILNRFRNMAAAYGITASQIGNRARHLEHTVVCSRRPIQARQSVLQQLFAGRIGLAVKLQQNDKGRGKLTVAFKSNSELQKLLALLR